MSDEKKSGIFPPGFFERSGLAGHELLPKAAVGAGTTVVEERRMTIEDLLMRHRIVFLEGIIDYEWSNNIIKRLLFMQYEDRRSPINLYVSNVWGDISTILPIYDTIQYLHCKVHTVGIGMILGAATIAIAAGEKGERYCLPNTRIMISQPKGRKFYGQTSDVEIHFKEWQRDTERLKELLVYHTGQDAARIEKDFARDFWMGAAEAKEYGIVDEILEPKEDEEEEKEDEKSDDKSEDKKD
ncbi:MAG: ATP-dependent Clp protease proteolytic subunit [Planctomycetota bacterium]|nr:MAG: ATP-dependent Clp protease proteolytic subunit [Planctomycetota bacterium]